MVDTALLGKSHDSEVLHEIQTQKARKRRESPKHEVRNDHLIPITGFFKPIKDRLPDLVNQYARDTE